MARAIKALHRHALVLALEVEMSLGRQQLGRSEELDISHMSTPNTYHFLNAPCLGGVSYDERRKILFICEEVAHASLNQNKFCCVNSRFTHSLCLQWCLFASISQGSNVLLHFRIQKKKIKSPNLTKLHRLRSNTRIVSRISSSCSITLLSEL